MASNLRVSCKARIITDLLMQRDFKLHYLTGIEFRSVDVIKIKYFYSAFKLIL